MTQSFADLSIEEIRQQLLRAPHISPATLNRLKRDPRRGVQRLYEQLKKRYDKGRSERLRVSGMLNFENLLWRSGCRYVAGVDEVGVGPLAGPVVAAAVVFPPDVQIDGIDDSKKLEPEAREELAPIIREKSLGIGLGLCEVGEIDELNIYHASLLAMRRAVAALPMRPDHILVDSRTIPEIDMPQNAFQKGDGLNFSIAAASVVAKTHRDRLMCELDAMYPGYGFARHKGYATLEHQEAIGKLGPCLIHRMSFSFMREVCGEFSERFYALKRCLEQSTDRQALHAFEQRLARERDSLADNEQRKLRLLLTRRWKNLSIMSTSRCGRPKPEKCLPISVSEQGHRRHCRDNSSLTTILCGCSVIKKATCSVWPEYFSLGSIGEGLAGYHWYAACAGCDW